MADVGGVSQRSAEDKYWDDVRDADSGPSAVTTASVMMKTQMDAGFAAKAIRGDDLTLEELVHEQNGIADNGASVGALVAKGVEAVELVGPHLPAAVESGVAGAGIAAPVLALGLMMHEVGEARLRGEARSAAIYRDQTHVAMLVMLKLPDDFRTTELKRYPQAVNESQRDGTIGKLTTQLNSRDRGLVPLLQLHCDRGMAAAKDAIDSKMTAAGYLQTHPAAAERYASDPAYKAGFDAMMWARARGDAPYAAVCNELKNRSKLYHDHQIQVRA